MTYFVTGATGFIGRHLVERLLEREGDIHVLVREGSQERLDRLVERWGAGRPHQAGRRRPRRAAARAVRRAGRRADRQGRALLPPRRDVRHDRGRREQRAPERRGHAPRRRARQRDRGRPSAPRLVGRRRRRAPRAVSRGPLRRGPEAAVGLSPHEVRVREARARAGEGAVARVPPRDRRRPLEDRRDGQDRRPVLLLQGDPEGPRRAAAVGPAGRPGARLHEHRAGRLRRRRDGPHRPRARPRRAGVPPHEPQADARRRVAERVRRRRRTRRSSRCASTSA